MAEPFASAWALLDRAREHTAAFSHQASSRYTSRKPYAVSEQRNTDTGMLERKVKITRAFPLDVTCVAFDAINCLRSAMDYAVYAAVQVVTGVDDPQNTKFPFGDTYIIAEQEFERGGCGVPASLRDFLLDFEPYESGNKALWGFNKIRNTKIHRALTPIAAGIADLSLGGEGMMSELIVFNEWDAATQELTVSISTDMTGGMHVQIAIDVAFDKSTALPLEPVVGTLHKVAGITTRIIAGLENEAARIVATRPTP